MLCCFLWNPLWSILVNTLIEEEIFQRSRSSLCTSDHNTVKYTGSKPKGHEKFVTHDYIIHSPDTVFLVLFFLSQFLSLSLSLFSLLICEEMFLHLFCVIEEGDTGESVQPWVRERIQSQLVCRSPVMSKRDKMKVCSVCHVPQPLEALWGRTIYRYSCGSVIVGGHE